ncbi:hypothetical protein M316_0137 [Nitrincola phage 1M3-16]|uniref:hypothetical protein n=1 Tax=Nitrincola phage 1M3-16 TaxID=1472912 RepID=UPI000444C34F|nr:hypothetical protein GJ22_gp015 [Nitrincola phage 1M3-16]AHX01202.1 hypothetical protein M316_0137 [Nitrincola phage 1M3-16]
MTGCFGGCIVGSMVTKIEWLGVNKKIIMMGAKENTIRVKSHFGVDVSQLAMSGDLSYKQGVTSMIPLTFENKGLNKIRTSVDCFNYGLKKIEVNFREVGAESAYKVRKKCLVK